MLDQEISSPAERGARRRERTKAAVMDAAEQLMADSGEPFKVEDVANRAGVSPASIYTHFGTKDALRASVVERLLGMMESTLQDIYSTPGPPLDRLQKAGLRFMELLLSHPALSRHLSSVSADTRESATEVELQVAARLDGVRQGLEDAIRVAVETGNITGVDARLLSFTLLATWTGMAALQHRRDELHLSSSEIESALLQTIHTFTSGLQATTGATS